MLTDGAANRRGRSLLLSGNAWRRKDVKTMAGGKEFTVSWPSWLQELLQTFASVRNVHTSCVGGEVIELRAVTMGPFIFMGQTSAQSP